LPFKRLKNISIVSAFPQRGQKAYYVLDSCLAKKLSKLAGKIAPPLGEAGLLYFFSRKSGKRNIEKDIRPSIRLRASAYSGTDRSNMVFVLVLLNTKFILG